MRQRGRSRSELGEGRLDYLVARIEQALASVAAAEFNLKNLRISRLPQVAESLSAAAADLESLRSTMPAAGHGVRNTSAVRMRLKRLEYASARISALHRAASEFHLGLMLARQREVAEYDAMGVVCGTSGNGLPGHCLETRG